MKAVVCLALVTTLVGASSSGDRAVSKVTPVEKVLELMNDMVAKNKAERDADEIEFATYKQFCDGTSEKKKKAIAKAAEEMDSLKVKIQKNLAHAEKLAKEITGLEEDVAVWNGDIGSATRVREIEKSDYDAMHKDYSESIDALTRAINVLKKQAAPTKQFLLQVSRSLKSSRLIPDEARRAMDTYMLQQADDGLEVSSPEANAYEFQSQQVVTMLQKMLDKFIEQRTVLEKEEMDSVHAFEMLMQDLNGEIEVATEDIAEKKDQKAKKLQAKADAEGDLADVSGTHDADVHYLTDLVSECEKKGTDYQARQDLRAEEREALGKAIEIISGGAVAGSAEKHLPTLLDVKAASLAQLRASEQSPTQARVAQFLQTRAKAINSRVLAALAVHVAGDPFKKVKKMIRDLIQRLMEEANEEASHKGWCDTELSTNAQTRKEKMMASETLTAEIDQLTASVAVLTEEIAEVTAAIADLDAAMLEATKIRAAEKEKNTQTIKDAQDAQTAVAQALTVLEEFYAKAAEAGAFVQVQQAQQDQQEQPQTGASTGVIGMLEVIEADFARLEADTKAAEASAAQEYDQFMKDSEIDKMSKEKDLEYKTAKKQDQDEALLKAKVDLESTEKELTAAIAYYDKLKPSCVETGISYEERVARRKEEIESLQDALKVLNNADVDMGR
jgi:hypothetical protein